MPWQHHTHHVFVVAVTGVFVSGAATLRDCTRRGGWRLPLLGLVLMTGVALGCGSGSVSDDITEGEHRLVLSDGTGLFFRVIGTGRPIVVIPVGFYLEEPLRELANGRTLVFFDPRGRARSDRGVIDSVSLDRQVRDVEELRVHLGAATIDLIGWSGLGMEMAVYALRYPDRVRRLVQMSAVPPSEALMMQLGGDTRLTAAEQAALARLDSANAAGEFRDREADLCRAQNDIFLPSNFVDRSLSSTVTDVCQWPNEWPTALGEYFDRLLGSFGGYDWLPQLDRLDHIPRLVVHGEQDGIPIAGAIAWARGRPNARLIRVSNAGHFPFIERREAVLPAIDRFLRGEWPNEAVAVP